MARRYSAGFGGPLSRTVELISKHGIKVKGASNLNSAIAHPSSGNSLRIVAKFSSLDHALFAAESLADFVSSEVYVLTRGTDGKWKLYDRMIVDPKRR